MSLLATGITPNWNKWINVPNVLILEGVDLSLNIESPNYDPFYSSDHHHKIAEHLTSEGLKEHGDLRWPPLSRPQLGKNKLGSR